MPVFIVRRDTRGREKQEEENKSSSLNIVTPAKLN